jgi:iron(III) transport system ATP-binding protein
VGMADRAKARPQELSGGQQQRVALARALAPRPDVILLDEPFSALDAGLRGAVRAQVKDVLAAAGTTAILVTHDQDEALSMADQVAVMAGGTVVQVGPPTLIYDHPVSLEVARFVGDVVECPGTVDHSGRMHCILGSWPTDGASPGAGLVLIRPEQLRLTAHTQGGPGAPARVVATEYHGHDTVVHVVVGDAQRVTVRLGGPTRFTVGDVVTVDVQGTPLWFAAD